MIKVELTTIGFNWTINSTDASKRNFERYLEQAIETDNKWDPTNEDFATARKKNIKSTTKEGAKQRIFDKETNHLGLLGNLFATIVHYLFVIYWWAVN